MSVLCGIKENEWKKIKNVETVAFTGTALNMFVKCKLIFVLFIFFVVSILLFVQVRQSFVQFLEGHI